ncbi:MAG: NAD(P)H-dependent oxidoreductase [Deltaproteobacteria bacterium]|nr:NAD(P)H-dependent oxidoreductase [Deltaproteobacteria bacterium]
MRVLGISGSLRAASYNSALLRACVDLAPDGMTIEITDLVRHIPLYDEDLEKAGWPAPVAELRAAIAAADALLIVSPEYNYSVPGALKNAIDWCSRGADQPFAGKPAAIQGASPGMGGTMRGQYHLRQIGVFLDLRLLNKPEVFLPKCAERFDADLRLVDESTRKVVAAQLVALRDHVSLSNTGRRSTTGRL